MIFYHVYSEEGTNKTLTKQFEFSFRSEPQAGDVMIVEGKRWIVQGRYWKENGNCVLLVRTTGGLVQA